MAHRPRFERRKQWIPGPFFFGRSGLGTRLMHTLPSNFPMCIGSYEAKAGAGIPPVRKSPPLPYLLWKMQNTVNSGFNVVQFINQDMVDTGGGGGGGGGGARGYELLPGALSTKRGGCPTKKNSCFTPIHPWCPEH